MRRWEHRIEEKPSASSLYTASSVASSAADFPFQELSEALTWASAYTPTAYTFTFKNAICFSLTPAQVTNQSP